MGKANSKSAYLLLHLILIGDAVLYRLIAFIAHANGHFVWTRQLTPRSNKKINYGNEIHTRIVNDFASTWRSHRFCSSMICPLPRGLIACWNVTSNFLFSKQSVSVSLLWTPLRSVLFLSAAENKLIKRHLDKK